MLGQRLSRRAFLAGSLGSLAVSTLDLRAWTQRERPRPGPPRERDARLRLRRAAEHLRSRYRDLPSHFVFEYYPWYATEPWRHWEDGGRTPPSQIATNYLPALGAYDSRSARVIEQHARWIADAGLGAIDVSWWGPGSFEDRTVPLIMDVMRQHGIQVTFHLEPYGPERAPRLAEDIKYLLREYGERRRWDNFLLLERADGSAAPVLKLFGSIVPPSTTDCLGVTRPKPDYVPDAVWRQQTRRLRSEVAVDFENFTLLADSLDVARTRAGGFDGGTSEDPYFHPERWREASGWFNAEDLLFVFGANAGFDVILPQVTPTDPCYRTPRIDPAGEVNWSDEPSRAAAHAASADRIRETFARSLELQIDRESTNEKRGFFLLYVNSFNEWHEGTQFEPMKPFGELTDAERRTYHNPVDGHYRMDVIAELIAEIV